jgi:NDP-sugar pyrophosphorylase family protein
MRGMVLAAGFGTRFRPATYEVPKPMVPLCNRPLIDYAIDALVRAGVRDVVVNLHHLPFVLSAHLDEVWGGRCRILYSHEEEILGTGGGIRRARTMLEGSDPFLLVNGDTVQFPPLQELEKARAGRNAVAALLLRHPPENDRFTPVYLDEGRITGFRSGTGEALMFSGAHSISQEIFSLLPDREFSGITEDVYIPLTHSAGPGLAGLVHDGPWFDIGTPQRYMEASHAVRMMMISGELEAPDGSRTSPAGRSIVADDAVQGSGEDLVVGSGSTIDAGARLRRSILWRDCTIAAGAVAADAILGDGVALRGGDRVENALLCLRRDVDYADGITVLAGHAAVPVDPSRPMIVELARGS